MNPAELQKRIDSCTTPEDMTFIALAYLDGAVLRDPVAAESWLLRAIDGDDPVWSPAAMGILARRILGKEQLFSPGELRALRRRAEQAADREKVELEALLDLV